MLTKNYNNMLRKASKKYLRKFEINFRKITIKLLKRNFNPNNVSIMENVSLLRSLFITYFCALRIRYCVTYNCKYGSTNASPSYMNTQRFHPLTIHNY